MENRENDPFTKKILLYTTVRDRHGAALLQEPLLVEGLETLARDLQFYFTQNLGEQAWVGSKYTGIRDLTLENTKLLVKLLTPETANIKNLSIKYPVPYSNKASNAEDILKDVDSIMWEMRTIPIANIVEERLDDDLMRLDTLTESMWSLKQFMDRVSEAEMDANRNESSQLLTEVTAVDWEQAKDTEIQEARRT